MAFTAPRRCSSGHLLPGPLLVREPAQHLVSKPTARCGRGAKTPALASSVLGMLSIAPRRSKLVRLRRGQVFLLDINVRPLSKPTARSGCGGTITTVRPDKRTQQCPAPLLYK